MIKRPLILLVILCILGLDGASFAGFRNLKIGRLWHSIEDGGGMGWYNSNHLAGRYPFIWPAPRSIANPFLERRWEAPSLASASGYQLSVPNWVNQEGETIPIARVGEGGDAWFPSVKIVSRVTPPRVIVDDIIISDPWPNDVGDYLDPDLVSDQMTILGTRAGIGVDVIQKVCAYTNRHFWDFLVFDYTFTNTGKLDIDESIVIPDQILEEFYVHFYFRGAVSREGHQNIENWSEWVIHEFMEYNDEHKMIFAWDGDSKEYAVEDAGDPHPATGYWLSSQYFGLKSIHADQSPSDETNSADQPLGSTWQGFSITNTVLNDLGNATAQEIWLSQYCDTYFREPSWQGSGGNPTWEGGDPNWHGESQMRGLLNFGPYRMEPDDDVRIVIAYLAGGLSEQLNGEFGREYKIAEDSGNLENFSWFDPVIGPPPFRGIEAKYALLNTGRDSLYKVSDHIQWLYDNDFNCPDPPVSPSLTVKSSGGKIIVEWGNEPENEPDPDTGEMDFAGYRLYRSIGKWDTTGWEMIYDGTDHIYEDTNIPRGVATYYYVTAYDDGSQTFYGPNDLGLEDGESLESSPHWNMTTVPAYRLKDPERNLSMVDVVPNPYNINAAPYQYPGEPNKILFVNLTSFCTINIYTVSGDKVRTLEHTSGSAEEAWDQITESNQYVTSGVYIYHISGRDQNGNKTGEEATGKFIIIR